MTARASRIAAALVAAALALAASACADGQSYLVVTVTHGAQTVDHLDVTVENGGLRADPVRVPGGPGDLTFALQFDASRQGPALVTVNAFADAAGSVPAGRAAGTGRIVPSHVTTLQLALDDALPDGGADAPTPSDMGGDDAPDGALLDLGGTLPRVISLSPPTIATTGNVMVTVTGANFMTGATVTVGAQMATNVVVTSDTRLTFTAPPSSSTGLFAVKVTNPGPMASKGGPQLGYYVTMPTFGSGVAIGSVAKPQSITTGHFFGNGRADVAVSNCGPNQLVVFPDQVDGSFGAAAPYPVPTCPGPVLGVDFSGMGFSGLVTIRTAMNEISIRTSNAGDLSGATTVKVGAGPRALAIGKFTTNKLLDIVVANYDDASFTLVSNSGAGYKEMLTVNLPGATEKPSSIVAADLDADKFNDVALAITSTGEVAVYKGTGSGSFAGTPKRSPAGASPVLLVAGDLNLDGRRDLVAVGGSGRNAITVLLNQKNDDTFTATAPIMPTTKPISAIALGDIDGDGYLDLVVASSAQDALVVLHGTGTGSFALPAIPIGAPGGPSSVVLADFNNDKRLDVATSDDAAHDVKVFLNTSTP